MKRVLMVALVVLSFLALACSKQVEAPYGDLASAVSEKVEVTYPLDLATVQTTGNTSYVPVNRRMTQAEYVPLRAQVIRQFELTHPELEVLDVDIDKEASILPGDIIRGIEIVHRPKPKVNEPAKVEGKGCKGCGDTITNNYYCKPPVVNPAPKPAPKPKVTPKPRVRRPRPQQPCKPATKPNCTQNVPCPGGPAPCGITLTMPCDGIQKLLEQAAEPSAPPPLPPPPAVPPSSSSIDVIAPKAMTIETV